MPYAPEGDPKTAEIVWVGEAPAKEEMLKGRPFMGQAGRIHDECLQSSGILRSKCYTTNVFDFPVHKPKGDKANFFNEDGNLVFQVRKGFTDIGMESVHRLEEELAGCTSNIICPLGGPALLAVCGKYGIMKWRGSILPSTMERIKGRKCIPSIHPINASYGEYVNRYIIRRDYIRAKRESEFPEINRPIYRFILYPTFAQCLEHLHSFHVNGTSPLAVDIEISKGQIECISYAWSEEDAICIPYQGWSEIEEAEIWRVTAEVLERPDTIKIYQNGVFDCQILAMLHGIISQGRAEDTMIAHHIIYPDFRKGLGFLGSLYTDQPFWKDMVSHGEIDKEDG